MASRNYIKKNYIGTTLQKVIDSLNPARPIIYGKLRVAAGHDYWWFLEYGTGEFHEEPSESTIASPHLTPPPEVKGYLAEGSYDITASAKPLLVYVTNYGTLHTQKQTHHPGVKPLAIVRTALFQAHIYLKEAIKPVRARGKRKNWGYLPTRKELVELVNSVMQQLLDKLQATTPPDSDPNPYHDGRHPVPLAAAWFVTKAR